MNSVLRFTGFALVSATLLFSAGCGKKPKRPNPGQTMMGQGPGDMLNPNDVGTGGVEQRVPGQSIDDAKRGVLPSVLFDFDSAAVRKGERAKLTQAAEYLKSHASAKLFLEGHCDWRGTTEYNMGLGDRRATSVKKFLVTLGVDVSRLETVSKGDLDAKENASASEMQQDRRVELLVLE